MEVGHIAFHVSGVRPSLDRVRIELLSGSWFSASLVDGGRHVTFNNWGQIFDNEPEAYRAILRNIDDRVAELNGQLADLLTDRAKVVELLK